MKSDGWIYDSLFSSNIWYHIDKRGSLLVGNMTTSFLLSFDFKSAPCLCFFYRRLRKKRSHFKHAGKIFTGTMLLFIFSLLCDNDGSDSLLSPLFSQLHSAAKQEPSAVKNGYATCVTQTQSRLHTSIYLPANTSFVISCC